MTKQKYEEKKIEDIIEINRRNKFFLFTHNRIYSLALLLLVSFARVRFSFEFDCYYAFIETKIEAYGYHFEG